MFNCHWFNNYRAYNKFFSGFIAQEIEDVVPELVRAGDDGYLAVRDRGIPALLLEAIKAKTGSKESNRNKIGSVTWDQVKTIAETKMPDLNCFTIESAMKMVAGTARSLGITVSGETPWQN